MVITKDDSPTRGNQNTDMRLKRFFQSQTTKLDDDQGT